MAALDSLYSQKYRARESSRLFKRVNVHNISALLGALLLVQPVSVAAAAVDDGAAPPSDGAFGLGQIIVTAPRPAGIEVSGETLTGEAIHAFNRQTLDDALSIMPGVAASNSGGSRNERLIFVRGFDRLQVPLSIDGIRVYLPADNRLDYGRFLTPDIAEVQVAKGFASVLDGPGAMGGAINLVTRKPERPLEGEVRATLNLGRDAGYTGNVLYGRIGTSREKWYAQASFARSDQDHWDLSGRYKPAAGSAEDGGARDRSASSDWRLNLKVGFTPNATDEYSLNYTRQEGAKNAPLHVTDPAASQRFWNWPWWNIDSLYLLTSTDLGEHATLKTRWYYNRFDNLLRSFNDSTQTSQSIGRAFNATYADKAFGGSAELGVDITAASRITIAGHYRRDRHVEWQQSFPSGLTEPAQTNIEDSFSFAIESRTSLSSQLRLTVGASYDWRDLVRAEEYGTPPGGGPAAIFSYPRRNADALNAQAQLLWEPDADTRVNASVSSRARFPTVFERFSTQFGTAASNPALKPERAINYELGFSRRQDRLRIEGALFYSDIRDAIVSVRPAGFPANSSQRQNLGDADYYGAEISIAATVGPTLDLGANYTWLHRRFSIGGASPGTVIPAFELTGVPDHKAFLYADWRPVPGLRVLPGADIASARMTSTTASPPAYYKTGGHVLASLRVDYTVAQGVEISAGARNLFDENYVLTDGFPEPGRSIFLGARVQY